VYFCEGDYPALVKCGIIAFAKWNTTENAIEFIDSNAPMIWRLREGLGIPRRVAHQSQTAAASGPRIGLAGFETVFTPRAADILWAE